MNSASLRLTGGFISDSHAPAHSHSHPSPSVHTSTATTTTTTTIVNDCCRRHFPNPFRMNAIRRDSNIDEMNKNRMMTPEHLETSAKEQPNVSHSVQFCETDVHMIDSLIDFIRSGIEDDCGLLLILSPIHKLELLTRLDEEDMHIDESDMMILESTAILRQIITKEQLAASRYQRSGPVFDEKLWISVLTPILSGLGATTRCVRATGEVSTLLFLQHYVHAAVHFEELSNSIIALFPLVSIHCTYTLAHLGAMPLVPSHEDETEHETIHETKSQADDFKCAKSNYRRVCQVHTQVLPGETIPTVDAATCVIQSALHLSREDIEFALVYLTNTFLDIARHQSQSGSVSCVEGDITLTKMVEVGPRHTRFPLSPLEREAPKRLHITLHPNHRSTTDGTNDDWYQKTIQRLTDAIAGVFQSRVPGEILDLSSLLSDSPSSTATPGIIYPLMLSIDSNALDGVLILGAPPSRRYTSNGMIDHLYEEFHQLIVSQVWNFLRHARSEERRRTVDPATEPILLPAVDLLQFSNQLRPHLQLIMGPLSSVIASSSLSPEIQGQIIQAHRHTRKLAEIVNTFVQFGASSLGEERIQQVWYERTSIGEFTRFIVEAMREPIEKAGLKLEIDTNDVMEVDAFVDRHRWEETVLQLVMNAFNSTFQCTISVSICHKHAINSLQLMVRDTGTGIPESDRIQIFRRFYKCGPLVPTRSREGLGIGLCIVEAAVKVHGGFIRLESKFGEGSSFMVTIPLGSSHLPTNRIRRQSKPDWSTQHTEVQTRFRENAIRWIERPTHTQRSRSTVIAMRPSGSINCVGATVLIASSSRDLADYCADILKSYWHVTTEFTVEDAMESINKNKPSLVIVDSSLPPTRNNQCLTHCIRDHDTWGSLPIISLIGSVDVDIPQDAAFSSGSDDFLFQPFTAKELLIRTNTHLELGRLRMSLQRQLRQQTQELSQVHSEQKQSMEVIRLQQSKREEAEKMAQYQVELSRMLSHETRNPLQAISCAAELLKRELEARRQCLVDASAAPTGLLREELSQLAAQTELEAECVEAIDLAARHSTVISNGVLESAKIESGQLALARLPFDAVRTIRFVLKMLKPQAVTRHITLNCEVHPAIDEIWLIGDPDRFAEIVVNLMNNALKFTNEGGSVTVRIIECEATSIDRCICVSVEDTGCGMTDEQQRGLFQRFAQGSPQVFHRFGGSGLGLFHVRRLIELMHGGINVESCEGAGTKFKFTIRGERLQPVDDEKKEIGAKPFRSETVVLSTKLSRSSSSASSSSSSSTSPNGSLTPTPTTPSSRVGPPPSKSKMATQSADAGRILVVEDNTANLKLLTRILQGERFECHTATDGMKALEVIDALGLNYFHVVLMDLQMPNMDGIEATRRIRDRESSSGLPSSRQLPIIALTGIIDPRQKEEAIRAGVCAILSKPINKSTLMQIMQPLVQARKDAEMARETVLQPEPQPDTETVGSSTR